MNKNNLTNVLFLIFIAVLTGCSGTRDRMEDWMGVNRSSVLIALGEPDVVYKTKYGDVLQFYRRKDDQGRDTCNDKFTLKNNIVTSYASDCGLWGGFSGPRIKILK